MYKFTLLWLYNVTSVQLKSCTLVHLHSCTTGDRMTHDLTQPPLITHYQRTTQHFTEMHHNLYFSILRCAALFTLFRKLHCTVIVLECSRCNTDLCLEIVLQQWMNSKKMRLGSSAVQFREALSNGNNSVVAYVDNVADMAYVAYMA